MHADEIASANDSATDSNQKQIASWGHLVGFLLIMAGIAAFAFRAQQTSDSAASTGQLAGPSKAIYVYLVAGVMDWLFSTTAGLACITAAAL